MLLAPGEQSTDKKQERRTFIKKINLILLLLFVSFSLSAQTIIDKVEANALSMVPKGEVLFRSLREVTLKTEAGTKVKLEFEMLGKLQEATGLNLNRGDQIEPGHGLISLSTAAQSLVKKGHTPAGEWNLEKDEKNSWVYELTEVVEDKTVYHLINAKNGKLIKSINLPAPSPIHSL